MKRNICCGVAACVIALVLASCASTSASSSQSASRLKAEIDTVNLGDFENVELGSGTMRVKRIFSGDLRGIDFSVMLYPRQGTAGVLYRNFTNRERLLLDSDARRMIVDAYDMYLEDFDAQALDRSQREFVQTYGRARCRIEWGLTYNYYANPVLEAGYIFVGRSPYFCLKINFTRSDQYLGADAPDVHYGGLVMYFTRAQALDLVDAIKEEQIQDAVAGAVLPPDDVYEGDYVEAVTPGDDVSEEVDEYSE